MQDLHSPQIETGAAVAAAALFLASLASCSEGSSMRALDGPREVALPETGVRLHATSAERFGFSEPSAPERLELRWDTPPGWAERGPSSLRVANFFVAGDERAECYLTLLPGDGGGLAANVNRWRAQMSQPLADAGQIDALERCEFFGTDAVLLDVGGTWTGMSGQESDQEFRLVGLLLVEPGGSAFLKMVGPESVVALEIDAFRALARSFRTELATPEHAAHGDVSPHGDPLAHGDPLSAEPTSSNALAGNTADSSCDSSTHDPSERRDSSSHVPRGTAAGIAWEAPPGWRRAPDRATRAVSFYVGSDESVECYVTILPGDAGGPLANVNRWRAQMGREVLSEAEFASLQVVPLLGGNGVFVEIESASSAETASTGASPSSIDQQGKVSGSANALLLGALGAVPGRSVFVKLTGARDRVRPQREAFLAFCASLSPSK